MSVHHEFIFVTFSKYLSKRSFSFNCLVTELVLQEFWLECNIIFFYRIPYEYSKEVLTPRLTYSRRTVNSNPFIDSADSMPSESHSWIPDSPLEGTQSFFSPQLTRKTQTLPVRQRKTTEEYCFACDESTQTQMPERRKRRCVVM